MKLAFLILAHENPIHFKRLVNAISSPNSSCFVHIDKKTNINNFSFFDYDNVIFIKERYKVYRADFSHVEAELMLIKQALNHPAIFDRLILISGTDYPLKTINYIEEFFINNPTTEFMNITPMPNLNVGKPLSRLVGYKPTPPALRTFLELSFRGLLKRLGIIPKIRDYQKYMNGLIPYAGSEWWALTRNSCEYIISFLSDKQKLLRFFKNTSSPQEMFFQTVLGNSPYKKQISHNVTYTDWSAGGGHPAIIEMKHLKFFESNKIMVDDGYGSGEVLFARKFTDESGSVIDALDQIIVNRNH